MEVRLLRRDFCLFFSAAHSELLLGALPVNAFGNPDPDLIYRNVLTADQNAGRHEEASQGNDVVGCRLVFLIDASSSITDNEYYAQLKVLASIFRHDDIELSIVLPGGNDIAVCIIEYADSILVRVPWIDFRGRDHDDLTESQLRERLYRFSSEIGELRRASAGDTNYAGAVLGAVSWIQKCPWPGKTTFIDLFCDAGSGNTTALRQARTATEAIGATVSAFPIVDSDSTANFIQFLRNHIVSVGDFFESLNAYWGSGSIYMLGQYDENGHLVVNEGQVRIGIRNQIRRENH